MPYTQQLCSACHALHSDCKACMLSSGLDQAVCATYSVSTYTAAVVVHPNVPTRPSILSLSSEHTLL